MVLRYSERGLRGLSNTLAGLIILSFMLVAVLPFIVNVVTGGAQASLRVASLAAEEVKAAKPSLNVTLDVDASTANTKVYKMENIGSKTVDVEALLVEASNGQAYIVVPGNCTNPCTLPGTTTIVDVDPAVFSEPLPNGVLRILPRGLAYVKITNGRLLGVVDIYGGYVSPQSPTISQVTVAQYAEYAAVAGSVQTNYFQLSNYTDLSDLLDSSDVALVTDPADETSDPDILWTGMLQANCLVDGDNETGGFTVDPNLQKMSLRGFVLYNVQLLGGSFALGGVKTVKYTEPYYGSGLFATFYSFAPFNDTEPGVVVAYRSAGNWFAIFMLPDDGEAVVYQFTGPSLDAAMGELYSVLLGHVYGGLVSSTYSLYRSDEGGYPANIMFDTNNWGLIATVYISSDEYVTFYCPPEAIDASSDASGLKIVLSEECNAVSNYRGYLWRGYVDPGDVWRPSYVFIPSGYYKEVNGTYIGYVADRRATAYIRYTLNAIAIRTADAYFMWEPVKLKVTGNTTTLNTTVHIYVEEYWTVGGRLVRPIDEWTEHYERDGSKAFGFYYYSGALLPEAVSADTAYLNHISYGFRAYGLANATLTLFRFTPGQTSGLEAYTAFLDTDGNGMTEMIFMTEDAYTGNEDSWDDWYTSRYLYAPGLGGLVWNEGVGCLDRTLNVAYLKFLNEYAVNGSQIVEVSIQIRYTFHDNAGSDVNDVRDPMAFLMTFRLVDDEGNVYSTSDYIYQQLQNLEDTWPPNTNWVSDSVFLLVPNENRLFYVVFGFNDPYWWDSQGNDPDFTIAIEWLGMWYLHR